jgi:hypothetical protein
VPDTGIMERRGLRTPYIVVTGLSASGSGSQTWDWSNDKVSDFVETCGYPAYFAGLDDEWARYRCRDKLVRLHDLTMIEAAEVMRGATAVITFSTGLGVLAAGALHGTDVALVCIFDGETSWDTFRLPGAVTCSPDQNLSDVALRRLDARRLEHEVARLERERRARKIEGDRAAAVLASHAREVGELREGYEAAHRLLHKQNLEIEDLHRRFHQRNLDYEAVERQFAEAMVTVHDRTLELEDARRRYAAAHDALADMEMSRSWRWTKPLRMLAGESSRGPRPSSE